jgi:hypothetical protein
MKLALPFVALGLLVSPTFMGTSALGENPSVRAEEVGVGIRVENRDRDWYRDRHYWRGDRDRDDVVVIKKRHHRDWDDD